MHCIRMRLRWAAVGLSLCLMVAASLPGCAKTAGKLIAEIKPPTNVTAAAKVNFNDYRVKRIAVLPFKNESEDAGAGFKVASYFYKRLSTHKEYEVSPPLRAEEERLRIEFLRPRIGERIQEPAARLATEEEEKVKNGPQPGPEVQFDAVATGRIFRYRNRRGNFLLALEPASVAYEIYLISIDDGSILWQAAYDETQQPLDENLLLIDRYIKGGFWWQTSDAMTRVGMERVVKTFPGIKTEKPPPKRE